MRGWKRVPRQPHRSNANMNDKTCAYTFMVHLTMPIFRFFVVMTIKWSRLLRKASTPCRRRLSMYPIRTRLYPSENAWKFFHASSFAWSGSRMSGAMTNGSSASDVGSKTCATARNPISVIRPSAMSRLIRSLFISESLLVGRLGENRWANDPSSIPFWMLSIQP